MENSSKALIIAGAILIAILLISVGVFVINSANSPLDETKERADSQTARIFNEKFQKYAGKDKTAQDAKNLIMFVNSNTDERHKVGLFKHDSYASTSIINIEDIKDYKEYQIGIYTVEYDGKGNMLGSNGTLYYPDGTSTTNVIDGDPGYVYLVWIREQ